MAHYRGIDYMRWFLRHLDELQPLLSLPDQLRAASVLESKWAILRKSLDTVVQIFADAPLVRSACTVTPDEVHAMHMELEAKGLQWEQVARLVQLLIDLIELLRGIELVYGGKQQ